MRYLSLFSGIEAASVAWAGAPLHWTPVGFAEIEPFPCAVLKHHYPEVPNLGDVTAPDFCERTKDLGPVELIIGGFPCQDLSVAGRRQGFAGKRSGLWFRFAEIIEQLKPQWVIVENVPGLLSSHGGRDFAVLLSGLVGCGYGVAWRILDARYWNLAQRRRRVFIVASLGDGRAAQVLFEPESLLGHPPPRRQARQATAAGAGASLAIRGRGNGPQAELGEPGIANTLLTPNGGRGGTGVGARIAPTCFQNYAHGNYRQGEAAETLAVSPGRQREANLIGLPDPAYALADGVGHRLGSGRDGQDTTKVSCPQVSIQDYRGLDKAQNGSGNSTEDLAYTLDQMATQGVAIGFNHQGDHNFRAEAEVCNPLRVAQTEAVCFQQNTRDEIRLLGGDGQIRGSLSAETGMKQQNHLVQEVCIKGAANGRAPTAGPQYGEVTTDGTTYTLNATEVHGAMNKTQIRRLLPIECERLMGVPDGYTDVPYKGKPAVDGPRYRALGNSMCPPVVRWLGSRIQALVKEPNR